MTSSQRGSQRPRWRNLPDTLHVDPLVLGVGHRVHHRSLWGHHLLAWHAGIQLHLGLEMDGGWMGKGAPSGKFMEMDGCEGLQLGLGCSCIWFASRIRLFKRCCKPTKPSASIYIYIYVQYLSDQPYANHGQDPSIDPIGPMMIQS